MINFCQFVFIIVNPYAMDIAKVRWPDIRLTLQLSDDWYAMDVTYVQWPGTARTLQLSNDWYMGGNCRQTTRITILGLCSAVSAVMFAMWIYVRWSLLHTLSYSGWLLQSCCSSSTWTWPVMCLFTVFTSDSSVCPFPTHPPTRRSHQCAISPASFIQFFVFVFGCCCFLLLIMHTSPVSSLVLNRQVIP